MKRKFSDKHLRTMPFEEMAGHIQKALADERYEDIDAIKKEQERRTAFHQNHKLLIPKDRGPFYVWTGGHEPYSEQQMHRERCKLQPPYTVFETYQEAMEWLQPEREHQDAGGDLQETRS